VAILLVSEDLDESIALSDRLVVMSTGKIAYSASINEIDRQLVGEDGKSLTNRVSLSS
jgi:ABC-type uncharacterized transport system ATPase subunit